MIKESIKELINAIAEGDTLAIEDSFNTVMASKISDRLDDMRVSVAQGMFGSVEESYDSSDAYETWDPKHPKFKEKLIKHQAKGGTTKSFIDQEKAKAWKKLTREEVELEELTLEDYSIEELEDFMMSEEFEQLDELSKKTLDSYVNKASDSYAPVAPVPGQKWKSHAVMTNKPGQRVIIQRKDIHNYPEHEGWKEVSPGQKACKESVEQIDELSKKTLGSYVKKASGDIMSKSGEAGYKLASGEGDEGNKDYAKSYKRKTGISKAVDKLTKD